MLLNDNGNAIICLQETWFTKQDLANLNALHPGFHGSTPCIALIIPHICFCYRGQL